MSNEDELNDIFNDNSLTQEEKVERINNYFGKQIKQIEKDYNITLTKMCIGEILILLSCLIPVGAGAKVSTTVYKTFITSNFGRQGKYGWHHVEVYKDGHKRFHITKDTINEGLRPTRPGDKDSANLIITDALKKVHPNNKNTPLIKLQVEKNVYQNGEPTGFAAPLSSQQDVYNINSDKYTRANKLSHRKISHREPENLVESVLMDIFDNFILRMDYKINNYN